MKIFPWDSAETVRRAEDRAAGRYTRQRSDDNYHSARWTRLSRYWRSTHPLCAECLRNGMYVEGQVVDHIVPWPVCGDFWDETNFQTLCRRCNDEKGNRDKPLIQQWRRTHSDDQHG